MNRGSVFMKEIPESALAPSVMWENSEDRRLNQEAALPKHQMYQHLDSGLPHLQYYEK